MRQSLENLIKNTLIFKYNLPSATKNIEKICISTERDYCYYANDLSSLSEIIYNSILDYSYDESRLFNAISYQNLHAAALKIKLKYNEEASDKTKLKYGFFGEVLLYSVLKVLHKADSFISRGYFYSPLENSETKGYDCYHLIENSDNTVEFWFGEAKFHINHKQAMNKIMENIEKALSDDYLQNNLLAMVNHIDKIDVTGKKIKGILKKWSENPEVSLIQEIQDENINTLVYPIFLICKEDANGYDETIKNIVEHISTNHSSINTTLSINHKIFFILMPINDVKKVKEDVIKWIEEKKQVMS